tara:strand:- start:6611 stop:7054 length:444 start_codon:yes stop_codon:yes gene_type:complete
MEEYDLLPDEFFKNKKINLLQEEINDKINNFIFPLEIKNYKYFEEYINFLKLKIIANILFGCDNLTPSKSINLIWLEHIRNKTNYTKFNELFNNYENFKYIKYNYHNNIFNTIYFYKKILRFDPLQVAWNDDNNEMKLNLSHEIVYY